MCDHCEINLPTRRTILKLMAAMSAAALPACQAEDPPLPLPDAYHDHLMSEQPGGAVRIDTSKVLAPPPTPATTTDHGSILPRSAWTSTPLTLRNGIPMESVSKLTIHHSGDGKQFLATSTADVIRHLQIVQQAHLQRGMVDIAYHFAVDRAGRAWQLRWLQYEGQHVRPGKSGVKNNPHNIGVVAIGDFNLQPLPAAQRDRLIDLVKLLCTKYALSSAAVHMHGELVDTDCPGKHLEPEIKAARREGAFDIR